MAQMTPIQELTESRKKNGSSLGKPVLSKYQDNHITHISYNRHQQQNEQFYMKEVRTFDEVFKSIK